MEADPLRDFRFSSNVQRRLVQEVVAGNEVYWRAGNSSGKTFGGAALGIALARGLKKLDGIKLPQVEMPTLGWVLSRTYKQQSGSVQKAYRHWIGAWPHEIGWVNRKRNEIGMIWVRPEKWEDDEPTTWSQIVFASQEHMGERSDVVLGLRLDWCHADEPPNQEVWREIRGRRQAERPFSKWITATPERREEWWWLEEDYAGCHDTPSKGRVLITSTIHDNRALSKAHIATQIQDWAGDPLLEARIAGIPVDTHSNAPFDPTQLKRWIARARKPEKVEMIRGLEVQVWGEADESDCYYLSAALASGLVSGPPLVLHVWSRRHRRLVAMVAEHVHPHTLGLVAADLSHRYNTALRPVMDPQDAMGYTDQFLEGLEAGRFRGELTRPFRLSAPESKSAKIGQPEAKATRDNAIAAIQRSLAYDDCEIPSLEVLESLRDCTVDDEGEIITGYGSHDKHLVCAGQALHFMNLSPAPTYIGQSEKPLIQRLRERARAAGNRRGIGGPVERWTVGA